MKDRLVSHLSRLVFFSTATLFAIHCASNDTPSSTASPGSSGAAGTAGSSAAAGTAGQSTEDTDTFLATEILGRPTDSAISINVVPAVSIEAYVEFGAAGTPLDNSTQATVFPEKQPFVLRVDGLSANTAYGYRLRWRRPGEPDFKIGPTRAFQTQRAPGTTFRFTLQADSHMDENSNLDQYHRTLANVQADAPDFHIDLGDTFMCEKHAAPLTPTVEMAPDFPTVDARYLYERDHFGIFAHSSPLFLVNGNHEGELGFLVTPSGNDVATWATLARHKYYMNPTPDSFYSGDSLTEPNVGERAAWYSWQWGDALFVALDPFWNTQTKSPSDGWVWTLGETQYQWMLDTLSSSQAKYKFVFLHNLVGGLDGQMRGGVEAAPFFEWGGKNNDGSDGFTQHRPGWAKPIHQVLVDTHLTAVFHGHDHLYARQSLDGILYQEVPQPSSKNTQNGSNLAQMSHYASGIIMSSAGHVRVTVAPDHVTTEYVRAWLPSHESATQHNGEIADAFTIPLP